jgi:predicted Rossmann fold flavoprotein
MIPSYDVVIIGAGAAGLMCAIEAGKRGRRVLVLDHARKAAEKIRISGGGRSNFTNLHATPANYISANPHFCRSALARYTQHDFIALVKKHRIRFHEKTLGQLFCDDSSQDIIDMLLAECASVNVDIRLSTSISAVEKSEHFTLQTSNGAYHATSLVVACGGLSIPKMGATGFGYELAKQFGHSIIPTEAALVPFTLSAEQLAPWQGLSGVAVDAIVQCNKTQFQEGMLFTHRGLSGPSILQISSYWQAGQNVRINLLPERDVASELTALKASHPRQEVAATLAQWLPKRLGTAIATQVLPEYSVPLRMADLSTKRIAEIAAAVNGWMLMPAGTEGYRTAEVTRGGVDTRELSSKTMESTKVPNLYFIGEVVDVTGWLGGYNFQWAWSSGFSAGQAA